MDENPISCHITQQGQRTEKNSFPHQQRKEAKIERVSYILVKASDNKGLWRIGRTGCAMTYSSKIPDAPADNRYPEERQQQGKVLRGAPKWRDTRMVSGQQKMRHQHRNGSRQDNYINDILQEQHLVTLETSITTP